MCIHVLLPMGFYDNIELVKLSNCYPACAASFQTLPYKILYPTQTLPFHVNKFNPFDQSGTPFEISCGTVVVEFVCLLLESPNLDIQLGFLTTCSEKGVWQHCVQWVTLPQSDHSVCNQIASYLHIIINSYDFLVRARPVLAHALLEVCDRRQNDGKCKRIVLDP